MAVGVFTRVVCCALLAGAELAHADEQALQPVIVKAPVAAPGEAERTPAAAVTVIDVEAQASEGRSTAALIARAPGVVVRDYGGPGQLATLSLRGASAQQCLVLLDGVPVTSAASGLVNLATLPPALLERIEVIRGSVGPLLGPGAMGGAINLVSRLPRPGPPSVEAEVRGGSFGTGEARLSARSNLGPGSALVALDALGTRGDFGYRPTNGTTDVPRTNNDATQLAGLLRYLGPAGTRRTVDVQLQLDQGRRGLAGTVENPSALDRLDDARALGSVRLTQRQDSSELELRGFGRQEQLAVQLSGPLPPPQRDTLLGAEGRGRLRLGHHGLSALLRVAGESLRHGDDRFTRPDLAAGITDEWLLAEGQLSILPSMRIDHVDHFTGLSPQLAGVLRPAPMLELRGSVGQTFRAPTFAELYLDQGLVLANPELTSERALSVDLGSALQLGPVQLSAGGFATEYVDLIQYELYPGARAKPFNIGTALVVGGELEGSVRPVRELELAVSFTHLTSRDIHDDVRFYGHELPYHPHDRGGARATYASSRLAVHAEAYAQSSQYLSRSNTTALPGRVETSVGAAWRPLSRQPFWVGLEAQNLLDERSEDLYGYPLPGRALYALLRVAAALAPEHP
jgi:vitamin B12 transporter